MGERYLEGYFERESPETQKLLFCNILFNLPKSFFLRDGKARVEPWLKKRYMEFR